MKRIINISLISLLSIFLLLMGVLGLVFIFIEGRMLFSLEWTIYPNPFNIFIRLFLKLLLAIICISLTVVEVINFFKKNETITCVTFGANIGLFVLGILLFVLTTNYVDIVGIVLFSVILLIKSVLIFVSKYYPLTYKK